MQKQMGEALKEGNRMGYRGRSAGLITGIMAVTTGLALLGLPSRACRAQDNPGQTIVSRVDLVEADLQQAIQLLKAQTGIEIMIASSEKPYGRITMTITNRPLDFVLNQMCRLAGAAVRVEKGVYVVGPKEAFVDPKTDASVAARVQSDPLPTDPPVVRKLRTEKIR